MRFLSSVVGSFSRGAAANPTVSMMEACFAHEGLDWRYVNCEVDEEQLGAAVAGAHAMGWRGFNCSTPHKQTVISLLDDLGASARIGRAVNCVVRTDAGWVGHNTDGVGFVRSAQELVDLDGVDSLVIGSGGAAHAIAIEVARAGRASCVSPVGPARRRRVSLVSSTPRPARRGTSSNGPGRWWSRRRCNSSSTPPPSE